jgi:hypothetical protein
MVAAVVEPERLLFVVDECGVHTSLLAPIYGYAPIDERLQHLLVPRNRAKKNTQRYFRV